MKYKNRVLLYGYTSVNLGDDLFFKIIAERFPNTLFVLPAHNIYKEIFRNINNLLNCIYRCYKNIFLK